MAGFQEGSQNKVGFFWLCATQGGSLAGIGLL